MPRPIRCDADDNFASQAYQENVIAYLRSPEALECLADACREARRLVAGSHAPAEL